MATVKISLTRALSELKTLDSRIHKVMSENPLAATMYNDKFVEPGFAGRNKEEVEKLITSAMERVKSLIKRREEIKNKLIEANNCTIVTVGKEQYSIAQAIDRKKFVEVLRGGLRVMRQKLTKAEETYEDARMQFESNRQATISNMTGGKDIKEGDKNVAAVLAGYDAANRLEFIDPCKAAEYISNEMEKLEEFVANVDFVLSEANSRTEISIEE